MKLKTSTRSRVKMAQFICFKITQLSKKIPTFPLNGFYKRKRKNLCLTTFWLWLPLKKLNMITGRFSRNEMPITVILLVFMFGLLQIHGADKITCFRSKSPCRFKEMPCPAECPSKSPSNQTDKVCYVKCESPICKAECKSTKPNCNGPGSACLDPRFIGADGIVFYFHGRSNEHFSLVSDPDLQINARFIGLRPASRARDFTWIQALGFLFNSHSFSLEAKRAVTWDSKVDHLTFAYDRKEVIIPDGRLSQWRSSESNVTVQRTSTSNSVLVTLPEIAEISVNVVPITKEDDRVHNYQIPKDDCFAHLEVQFRFHGLSSKVEGVLGRTYQPDFKNPAKPGVAMPVVGGDKEYRTSSLLSADCSACLFSPARVSNKVDTKIKQYSFIDCSGGSTSGNGIVCRK